LITEKLKGSLITAVMTTSKCVTRAPSGKVFDTVLWYWQPVSIFDDRQWRLSK